MRRRERGVIVIAMLIACAVGPGCGGVSSYAPTAYAAGASYGGYGTGGYDSSGYGSVQREASYGDAEGESLSTTASESSGDDVWRTGATLDEEVQPAPMREPAAPLAAPQTRSASATVASPPRESPPMAQVGDARRREVASAGQPQQQAQQTATDAVDTSGPLLIYTGLLHLAVYEVAESQARIIAAARELGGFVFAQADDRIVVRVPAPRFYALIESIEQTGDVEHRDVQAQDVSEEFHDLEIRIRNLEAMRRRVEALLAQAQTVEDALRVEQELHRITAELERMRGRQRFLADRIALSTVTVLFRPRPREMVGQPDIVELPFAWLDQLGLSTLLQLR